MNEYEVILTLESEGEPEDDPEVTKIISARDEGEAINKARSLLRDENPEFRDMKIWAWSIRDMYRRRA